MVSITKKVEPGGMSGFLHRCLYFICRPHDFLIRREI